MGTPKSSPPPSPTATDKKLFFPPPLKLSDGPSPSKRPRFASTPGSNTESEGFISKRRDSSLRVLKLWSGLEKRYARGMDEDDIVDLRGMVIVKDRDVVRNSPRWEMGCFAQQHEGAESSGGDEEEEEQTPIVEEEEGLGEWVDHAVQEQQARRVPPAQPLDPEDAADLREFFLAESRRVEDYGDVDEGVEDVPGHWSEGSMSPEPDDHDDESEHPFVVLQDDSVLSSLPLHKRPTVVAKVPLLATSDDDSDDEFGSMDVGEGAQIFGISEGQSLTTLIRPMLPDARREPSALPPQNPILQLQTPPLSQGGNHSLSPSREVPTFHSLPRLDALEPVKRPGTQQDTQPKRKRGRPKKVVEVVVPKRPIGRPRKHPPLTDSATSCPPNPKPRTKRKRAPTSPPMSSPPENADPVLGQTPRRKLRHTSRFEGMEAQSTVAQQREATEELADDDPPASLEMDYSAQSDHVDWGQYDDELTDQTHPYPSPPADPMQLQADLGGLMAQMMYHFNTMSYWARAAPQHPAWPSPPSYSQPGPSHYTFPTPSPVYYPTYPHPSPPPPPPNLWQYASRHSTPAPTPVRALRPSSFSAVSTPTSSARPPPTPSTARSSRNGDSTSPSNSSPSDRKHNGRAGPRPTMLPPLSLGQLASTPSTSRPDPSESRHNTVGPSTLLPGRPNRATIPEHSTRSYAEGQHLARSQSVRLPRAVGAINPGTNARIREQSSQPSFVQREKSVRSAPNDIQARLDETSGSRSKLRKQDHRDQEPPSDSDFWEVEQTPSAKPTLFRSRTRAPSMAPNLVPLSRKK